MNKAPLIAGFLMAAQPVFAQEAATSVPAPDLSKFISLPDGPKGQWIIHGKNENEVAIRCVKGKKTADGKLGQPYLSIKANGGTPFVVPAIDLDIAPEVLGIPKSVKVPAKLTLSLDPDRYCKSNGEVRTDGGQNLVDDIVTQAAQQLKVPKPTLVSILATLTQ